MKKLVLASALVLSSAVLFSCQKKEEQPAPAEQSAPAEQQAPAQQQPAEQPAQPAEQQSAPAGQEQKAPEGQAPAEQQPKEQKSSEQTSPKESEKQVAKKEEKKAESVAKVDGKALFTTKGCTACHQEATDAVGPALKKIAAVYAGKEADLIKFLKGESQAIVDPAKAAIMQPQINTTKALSDEERKALAEFILSHK